MPSVKACGRCGTSLQLGAMAISVYPPRASAWAKWWRRWFWSPRINWRRAAELGGELLLGANARRRPSWPAVSRMVIPGWPQIHMGQVARGWSFLGAFLALGFLALISLGTVIGSVFLGLAVAAHAASVLDVVIGETGQSRARFTYAIFCLAGLGLAVYWPLSHVTSAWIVPRQIAAITPPFLRGDVVLISSGLYTLRQPKPGDVVLYEIPRARVGGRYWGMAANYDIQGQRIDRIIAGPGQQVRMEGTRLLVDEKTSDYLPLNAARMPGGYNVKVPSGHYLIFPTTAIGENLSLAGLNWEQVSLVPAHQIVARVYLRHWPWGRFTIF
jgi:hypothetical protein